MTTCGQCSLDDVTHLPATYEKVRSKRSLLREREVNFKDFNEKVEKSVRLSHLATNGDRAKVKKNISSQIISYF